MLKVGVLSKWFNAVAEAYNRGEAPWAYPAPDYTSESVRVWNRLGDEGFVTWVESTGITLKRKKVVT